MSVVEFLRLYPAEVESREALRTDQALEAARGSLVSYFATKFARAGSEELRRLTSLHSSGSDSLELNEEVVRAVLNTGRRDLSGVFLGTAVISIEQAIVDGCFDPKSYGSRLQEYFKGTVFVIGESGVEDGQIEEISPDQRRLMIRAAEEDKTFAIFFKNPRRLMPKRMRDNLTGDDKLDLIDLVLADYEERARVLIAQKTA